MVNNVIHDMPNLLMQRCQPPNLPDLFHKRNKLFPTQKQLLNEETIYNLAGQERVNGQMVDCHGASTSLADEKS